MCILQTRSYWKWGPMRLKLEVFEMQKCNISTDRAQRKDEQNRVIHLVMFTPSFRVIKMSKMVQFMYLLLNTAKICLERILKCNLKILFSPFWKYYGLCSFELPWVKFHHLKIQDFSTSLLTQQFLKYLFSISQKKSKAYYIYHFLEELDKIFHVFKYSAHTVTNILLLSAEISYFWYFQDYNSGCNHDN